MSPKCSSVVVTTSSPGSRSSPARTRLQPSVVDPVSATCSASTPTRPASSARSSARSARTCSMYSSPTLPSARFRSSSARMASVVARASGPALPAWRYATRSSTGNCARASSNVTRGPTPLLFPSMRVVLADPAAYTPPYDRSLAGALAAAGAQVELVTSRFRFGQVARRRTYTAESGSIRSPRAWARPGATRGESAGAPGRDGAARRARAGRAARAVVRRARGGSLALPAALARSSSPLTTSSRDGRPRRTGLWRSLFDRCDRVVVHSERGRESLAASASPRSACASSPIPRSARRSTGATTDAPRSPSG